MRVYRILSREEARARFEKLKLQLGQLPTRAQVEAAKRTENVQGELPLCREDKSSPLDYSLG